MPVGIFSPAIFFIMLKSLQLLVLITLAGNLFSQTPTSLVINKESSLVINGSTNISKFKLTLEGEDFPGPKFIFNTNIGNNKITLSQNKISLSVNKFHSGNILALNGFLKLIKAKEFPFLDIVLNDINIIDKNSNIRVSSINTSADVQGIASVEITLTGVSRNYSIPFKAAKKGEELIGEGDIRLTIKDFGLTPPVEMMGLVKISEWIDISIKLNSSISSSR
ncbi:MAG: hypothetical protein CVU13_08470 [Bacteroidetes bacterium HGW-Bacteroidetes-8]|jgi:hypothetical protein|nr:MAG: hypothetical protein CVU13_08470 [Bacteroidetes bacterium HGW-Bacteroidetes-8]